jgi:hypothetical protein
MLELRILSIEMTKIVVTIKIYRAVPIMPSIIDSAFGEYIVVLGYSWLSLDWILFCRDFRPPLIFEMRSFWEIHNHYFSPGTFSCSNTLDVFLFSSIRRSICQFFQSYHEAKFHWIREPLSDETT